MKSVKQCITPILLKSVQVKIGAITKSSYELSQLNLSWLSRKSTALVADKYKNHFQKFYLHRSKVAVNHKALTQWI
jgi:hypothetical protein